IYFTVEADGSVYPCDFYALDEWKLGNITNHSFKAMLGTEKARSFLDASRYISPECRGCAVFSLCRGGCRRDREPFFEGKAVLNRYCEAFKGFFDYAKPLLEKLAAAPRAGHPD
ncbi:MAG: SPASM domain-containing protein, partial [Spirochaetaceae bacterium]|nr:SPASM domain-containing protein [Spirochaetaceae bacterium]